MKYNNLDSVWQGEDELIILYSGRNHNRGVLYFDLNPYLFQIDLAWNLEEFIKQLYEYDKEKFGSGCLTIRKSSFYWIDEGKIFRKERWKPVSIHPPMSLQNGWSWSCCYYKETGKIEFDAFQPDDIIKLGYLDSAAFEMKFNITLQGL